MKGNTLMKKIRKSALALSVCGLLLLGGCFMPPPAPAPLPKNPDYGPPPPEAHQSMIRAELEKQFTTDLFIGSKPAQYMFWPPMKGHTDADYIKGLDQTFGWVVCGTFHRVENYAGYGRDNGPIPFFVLFKNGKIAERLIGHTTYDRSVPHALNDEIKKVCGRRDQ
jgi:hypothetical protein